MHCTSAIFLAFSLCGLYISSVHSAACSTQCDCSEAWVRCNQVESIADLDLSFANPNVETLEISAMPPRSDDSGRVLMLPKDFSRFSKLKRFSVENSGVSSIPLATAQQLSNVQELDLHGNRIFLLKSLNLDQMTNLQTLVLDGNHIKRIQAGDFSNNKQLLEIFMDNNDIKKLDALSFGNMPNLRRVMMKGNVGLKFVSAGAFDGSDNVEHLDFGGSSISEMPKAIANLKNLETLDLTNSKLSSFEDVDMAMLKTMSKLHLVNLGHTGIKCTQKMKKYMDEVEAIKMDLCSAV